MPALPSYAPTYSGAFRTKYEQSAAAFTRLRMESEDGSTLLGLLKFLAKRGQKSLHAEVLNALSLPHSLPPSFTPSLIHSLSHHLSLSLSLPPQAQACCFEAYFVCVLMLRISRR